MMETTTARLCLLVEDQPRSRDWLLGVLTAAFPGIGVVAFARRAEALAWLAERQGSGVPGFDLALIDLGLPDGSGIDLVRKLVEAWPDVMPVIATIYDDDAHIFEAIAAGARGYVLKDSPSAEIVAAIDAVGAGSRYFSARVADALVSASLPEPELTPREREVLDLIADGLGNKEIAARLDLSVRTVESHRINIKRKFDLDSAAALLKFALQRRRDHG